MRPIPRPRNEEVASRPMQVDKCSHVSAHFRPDKSHDCRGRGALDGPCYIGKFAKSVQAIGKPTVDWQWKLLRRNSIDAMKRVRPSNSIGLPILGARLLNVATRAQQLQIALQMLLPIPPGPLRPRHKMVRIALRLYAITVQILGARTPGTLPTE
jgi:hypothetical protein